MKGLDPDSRIKAVIGLGEIKVLFHFKLVQSKPVNMRCTIS